MSKTKVPANSIPNEDSSWLAVSSHGGEREQTGLFSSYKDNNLIPLLGQKCAIHWGGPGKIAGKSPARQALPLVKVGTCSASGHVEMRRLRRKTHMTPLGSTTGQVRRIRFLCAYRF